MPSTYSIDPSHGLGVIRLTGKVTGADVIGAVRGLYGDDGWVPGGRVLWDGRALASLDFAPDKADALNETIFALRERIGAARVAIVASCFDVYSHGLLFAIRSRKGFDRAVEVFNDLDAALRWLGVDGRPPALREP